MKTQQTFEEYLKKHNLSGNTLDAYLWTVDFYHTHYDGVTKENLLAYKGYLMEFFNMTRQLSMPKRWKRG